MIASTRSFSFLRFTVSFLQKRGFPLKAGGSPGILVAKTWQYLLKYECGVRFVFVVISLLYCYFDDHWRFSVGYVPSLTLVLCHYNLPLWYSSFSPLQLTRPHHIVALFFTLFPSLHSRRPSLCITFSPTLSIHHKTRSRSPTHRRGESEWITSSVLLNTEEGKVNGLDYA
jgi:hypothetical protein